MKNPVISNNPLKFGIRWIIAVTVLSVLISSCAMQSANSAGTINGKNIDQQDFMDALKGHFTGFILETDRTPDETDKKEIGRKTWRDITIHVILQDYFHKYQIQVSEQEVIDTLLNNIPSSMITAPAFQINGIFDKPMYVKSLLQDTPQKLDWLRKHYYQYYVPLQKLKVELQRKSVISKKELAEIYKTVNSKADIDWIVFDPAGYDVKVTQSEIENYYQSRLEDFKLQSYASFGWASIPVRSTEQDVLTAKAKIDSIYLEIRNGAPFSMLAEQCSESASAVSQGSLGFIKTENLPMEARQVVDGLDKNQTSIPLQLGDSWVIYELLERTKTLVKLNEIVIRIVPGAVTRKITKDNAVNLRDLAMQLGLKDAASEMSYGYLHINKAAKDSVWMADSGLCSYLMDRAVTQKPGAILEPVYSEVMQSWVLAEVIEVQPYQYRPLITVNDEIREIIKSQKQISYTLDMAKFWGEQHKSNQLTTATAESRKIIHTPDLLINGQINNAPIWKIYVEVLSSHQAGKAPKAHILNGLIVLPVVSKVTGLTPPLYDEQQVRQYYFTYINPDWFDKWLENEINTAKVNIRISYP